MLWVGVVARTWAAVGTCAAEPLHPARLGCVCSWGVRLAYDLQVNDFDVLLEGTCNIMSHRLKELN